MDQVARLFVRVDELGQVERAVGKVRWKTGIRRAFTYVERYRKRLVRFSVPVDLSGCFSRVRNSICTRKRSVQGIETPVFLVNNDDVLNVGKRAGRALRRRRRPDPSYCEQKDSATPDHAKY